jgi:hypothetical protein
MDRLRRPRRAAHLLVAGLFLSIFLVLGAANTRVAPWLGPFDELQHISYAAALQERGGILPCFEAQRVLEPSDLSRWTGDRNYLGHPSPYYALVALVLDRSLPLDKALAAPRLLSFLLVATAVALVLAAGVRHFSSSPTAMVAFCTLVALCPILFPLSAQVTNDTLAVLAGALAYWGAARGPRASVAALAAGLVLAMWAKPSAGLLVGAWAGCIAALWRSPRTLAVLAAAGAVGAAPYLDMLWRYGSVVPVTYELVSGTIGAPPPAAEYLLRFLDQFPRTWAVGETGLPVVSLSFGALLACAGWGAWLGFRGRDPSRGAIAVAAAIAFAAVLAVHLVYGALVLGGSRGAASFRYYLPLWPMLAHAAALAAAEAPCRPLRAAVVGVAVAAVVGGITS